MSVHVERLSSLFGTPELKVLSFFRDEISRLHQKFIFKWQPFKEQPLLQVFWISATQATEILAALEELFIFGVSEESK
ncbi:hypothetical protein M0802_004431 [Mischocyttarus mexicanus]|nr:hypothetical protein M0802_004431 [Mischocyttarus mexicanus]